MSLSELESVSLCVYMTGGEGLDEGQISHTRTKTAEHLTSTETREPVTERQHAGTLTVSGVDCSALLRF